MKVNVVNVIESLSRNGTPNFIMNRVHSFSNNPQGNKEAKKLFIKDAISFGCPKKEIKRVVKNCYYNGRLDSVWLVHSSKHTYEYHKQAEHSDA